MYSIFVLDGNGTLKHATKFCFVREEPLEQKVVLYPGDTYSGFHTVNINCRVLADGHIRWACDAFSRQHGQELMQNPALRW
jgi:hypothetical protein